MQVLYYRNFARNGCFKQTLEAFTSRWSSCQKWEVGDTAKKLILRFHVHITMANLTMPYRAMLLVVFVSWQCSKPCAAVTVVMVLLLLLCRH